MGYRYLTERCVTGSTKMLQNKLTECVWSVTGGHGQVAFEAIPSAKVYWASGAMLSTRDIKPIKPCPLWEGSQFSEFV